MKKLFVLSMLLLLSGCGWMNGNNNNNQTPNNQQTPNNNQQTPNGNGQTAKTSSIKDLMGYFDEKGLQYSNMSDLDVVEINAHEGKKFEYEGIPVYLYRMNMQDQQIQSWMKDIKDTGKVTISLDGEQKSYDAIINGDYLLVSETGKDLKDLSQHFKNYTMK